MDANGSNHHPKPQKQNGDLESKLTETVLKLEEIDVNLYRGQHLWKPIRGRGVFGGQVVGQALVAASNTRPDNLHVHSLHCYFLKAGNPDLPLLYHVERTRDGSSFSSRTVKATQKGTTMFSMIVSFHQNEALPVEHQFTMPVVPQPDELMTVDDLITLFVQNTEIPERYRRYMSMASEIPIEMKPVDPLKFVKMRYARDSMDSSDARLCLWIRVRGTIGDCQQRASDNNIHRCAVAYISDWSLLYTTLLPVPQLQIRMMASLDHSMWFHTSFRADEWMLYECESPRLINGRGLVLGRLWRQDGTLAVTVAQEGVVRGQLKQAKL